MYKRRNDDITTLPVQAHLGTDFKGCIVSNTSAHQIYV